MGNYCVSLLPMDHFTPKVFALCIIESLDEGDIETGYILSNELLKYKSFQEPNITIRYCRLGTKTEIIQEINFLYNKVSHEKWGIILHFETHGSESGIITTSGEILRWDELMNLFRPINILLKNALIVHLGMCLGGWIISAINPFERAPFKAVVATWKRVGERDLLSAFTEFYDYFFFEFNIWEAVNRMNSSNTHGDPLFYVMRIDVLFDEIVNPDRNPTLFNKLLNESIAKQIIMEEGCVTKSAESLRKELEVYIRDEFQKIRKRKSYFLMQDIRK